MTINETSQRDIVPTQWGDAREIEAAVARSSFPVTIEEVVRVNRDDSGRLTGVFVPGEMASVRRVLRNERGQIDRIVERTERVVGER